MLRKTPVALAFGVAWGLSPLAALGQQLEILIRGDRKVEYEFATRTLAAAQRVGVHKLGIVTEPAN